MDIQVGDRVTFENGIVKLIYDMDRLFEINQYINAGGNQIIKIERPNYEVVEEKKELLTEEERKFLKQYIKIIESLNNGNAVEIYRKEEDIRLKLDTDLIYIIEVGSQFGNMELCMGYTLKELGLEEN